MISTCTRRFASGTAPVLALALLMAAVTIAPPAAADTTIARDGRCLTSTVRALAPEPAPVSAQGPGTTPAGPPPNPQVGDEWLWYIWRLNGYPVADRLPCTVRGMGEHCYVVVENSQWNVNIDQADVNHIIERFDLMSIGPHPTQGIYDINVAAFGIPPDRLDMDPRIYIMYYDFDVNADGFFWYFDEYPDGSQPFASNECEVVYLNDSDRDPASDYMIAVLAHEFEHMIHWEYDENETSWVDEGLAEVAMFLYGYPDNISSFNAQPDNNLTVWNGTWADYIKTYLWTLYFYERYGGEPALYDVVHEPANSTLGYDLVLDRHGYTENFEDVFADWTVANYLDEPAIGDGRFGYVGEDLPPFLHSGNHSTYPVGPVNAAVNHWAADYVQFTNAPTGLGFGFDGNDLTRFALWALELDPVLLPRVTRVPLDAVQAGNIDLPDVGSIYERAVMVAAGISSAGGTNYSYTARTGVTAIADPDPGVPSVAGPVLFAPAPNPVTPATAVRFTTATAGPVRLRVFDTSGRLCRTLVDAPLAAGTYTASWNRLDGASQELASGVYFVRLEAGGEERSVRALVAR